MPGLEYAPSEMTKRTDKDPYGCHNLPRTRDLVQAQDGYDIMGDRRIVYYKDFGSNECRYDQSLTDKRCAGCQHAGSGVAYDRMIREQGS